MSWRRAILSGIALFCALLLTLGPKIWIEFRSAQIDVDRLDEDTAERLRTFGFRTRIEPWAPDPIIVAKSDRCDVVVRNGDRARELSSLFRLEMAALGPVEVGYRGVWSLHPARRRSVMERLAQDAAMRVGVHFKRPAVLAMANAGRCPDMHAVLAGLSAYSMLRKPKSEVVGE